MAPSIPVRHVGRAENIAYSALYLASDEPSNVSRPSSVWTVGVTALGLRSTLALLPPRQLLHGHVATECDVAESAFSVSVTCYVISLNRCSSVKIATVGQAYHRHVISEIALSSRICHHYDPSVGTTFLRLLVVQFLALGKLAP